MYLVLVVPAMPPAVSLTVLALWEEVRNWAGHMRPAPSPQPVRMAGIPKALWDDQALWFVMHDVLSCACAGLTPELSRAAKRRRLE